MKLNRSAWGRFALTHVAAATLSVASTAAWGLGLGRLNVQSALGETLSAEIDISSITPEEAGTLRVRVAPPEAYRSTGVEYNPVLTSTQVELARRSDGRPYLRINSNRAVQEPFVDVILEITWAGGRLVREYTLLFDPPSLARPVPPAAVATAPVIAPAVPEARPLPSAAPTAAPRPAAAQAPAASAAPAPAARTAAPTSVARPTRPAAASSQYAVKPGDSLSRVASRTKSTEISLDQMLVGLYRNNPDAFVGENMNRLKAGVVLQVPSSEALAALPVDEAREVVAAQSADFAAYRERLASGAPEMPAAPSARSVKGKVQAEVEDRKPAAAAAPDKLTLSKASSAAVESQASKEAERKAEVARVAELKRNVEELKQISTAAKPATTAAPAPAPAASAVAPAPTLAPALPPVASAPAPAAAAKPAASAVAASAPVAAPPAAEQPGVVESLMDHPLVLPVAAVLVALLGGLGLMRLRGRAAKGKADTGFHESRLQPDSFFGASGGQRVDTRDATSGASSMSYSLSQLDAIGDVDPVAEADVYLAYGRDLQAEEILKEALRANPERLAIRLKLLEVYAKRRDIKGFEQLAIQLYAETKGSGDDWAKAQELGRLIDPDNPLYQPGGAPSQVFLGDYEGRPEPMNASTLPQTAQHSTIVGAHLGAAPMEGVPPDTGPAGGLGLDLDLDLGTESAAVSPLAMEATQALATTVEQAPMAMDFDLSDLPVEEAASSAAPTALDELSFDLSDLEEPVQAGAAASAAQSGATSLDFDLSSIDLDLPAAPAEAPEAIPAATATESELPAEFDSQLQEDQGPLSNAFDALGEDDGDPLLRQLELAEEFRQIGDVEGARDVLQELLEKATGVVRDKAQAMLKDLH